MNKYFKVVLLILALGGFAFIIHINKKTEVKKYVVQMNEIVILEDNHTDKLNIYTFGDTLEVKTYQKITKYQKSSTVNFGGGNLYIIPKESLPKGSHIEF